VAPRQRLLLATRSYDKLREIRQILSHRRDLELLALDQVGIEPDPAEETVEAWQSFRENALAKARHFQERSGMAVIADDSGIEVEALGWAPGVRSRRFCGRSDLAGFALDQANNQLLLERLRDVPPERRAARYVCAAVLLLPARPPASALGTCVGTILDAPRGAGGFGYDPLFFIPGIGRSFGELDPDEKHRYSHRARAFRALPIP
jgi:XTP/dITP diphosphohydrolase